MITTREIVDRLKDIYDRLAAVASFRWGVVVSATPPLVRLDADTDPVIVGTIAPLTVGSRVLVVLQNRKNTVIGSAGGDPNEIVIDGTAYQRSGTLASIPRTPAFSTFGSTFARTINITLPFTPPAGWVFRWFTKSSSGYTTIERGQRENQLRIIQVGSNDVNALLSIGWELVKV